MNGPGPVTGDDRATARRVVITIGLLFGTVLVLTFVWATRRVLVWILVAVFFAVALYPVVNWTQRRLVRWRWLATMLVFLVAFLVLAALSALIIAPLVGEVTRLVERVPELTREARSGHGTIGNLLERFRVRQFVESHSGELGQYGQRLRQRAGGVIKGAIITGAGVVTVAVLAYLMVLQAPRIVDGVLGLLPERHAARSRRIGRECARTITGYLSGNLLISVIAGGLTFAVLAILGVPYAGVIATLVAVLDLIPLVGATIGGIISIGASFLHSARSGIVVLVFIVVYQLFENHVLQPVIYSRIIRLSPLTVLVSVLVFGELAGILGALLAIPVAAILQILLREARGTPAPAAAPGPARKEPGPPREQAGPAT